MQVVSRWVPLHAGYTLPNATQPEVCCCLGDGGFLTARLVAHQHCPVLFLQSRCPATPCPYWWAAILSQVQGATFSSVTMLLLVTRLLFFNPSSLFISCQKQTVFNNIHYPQQMHSFAVLLQGSHLSVNLQYFTKLKENIHLKSWLLDWNWHTLSIYIWLSKIEQKANFNYIAYQYEHISYYSLIDVRILLRLQLSEVTKAW